jgi:hypothetical protein
MQSVTKCRPSWIRPAAEHNVSTRGRHAVAQPADFLLSHAREDIRDQIRNLAAVPHAVSRNAEW